MIYIEIKKYLDEKGIKYTYIADKLGLSKSVVSAMLSGRRVINAEEFVSICNVLNVETDYFANRLPQHTA